MTMNLDTVLLDLVKPIVDYSEELTVKQLESSKENEVVLCIYAKKDDISKLIGRKGMMASAIRQVMGVACQPLKKHVVIHFEEL